ncbi:ABC transporter permease [Mucilaginibacter angelicae]|uniref:ABC transporter permease n=1 Tax=Mucilaginibacter angelicae TaxID=869718 RepID=A0ABV6L5U6_9SPHI
MIKNYLKMAWRGLIKNKVSSFINIGGLSIGMAVALLIALWVLDELTFDQYHDNYKQIAQVLRQDTRDGERITSLYHPMPLASELRNTYGSNFKYVVMARQVENHLIAIGDKKFTQQGSFMEQDAPDMFSLKMLNGSRSGLQAPNSILLSASLAKKLFGTINPINRVLKIDHNLNAKVTGVYEDLPDNSDFKDASFIAPFDLYITSAGWIKSAVNDWGNQNVHVYVQTKPGVDLEKISNQIKDLYISHISPEKAVKRKPVVKLQPMDRWHLYSKFENGLNVTSDELKFVWFYGIIGGMVLLMACINFMNLSTARSQKRAIEVGIRKSVGSSRSQLILQFYSESLMVAVFSFALAIAIVQLALPWFNHIAGKSMILPLTNHLFWLAGFTFVLFTGLLAGSYPALYLSAFEPTKVIKGTFSAGRFAAIPRKILVVVQFTVSIALIIGTITIYRQIQFTRNRPIGYSQTSLLTLTVNSPDYNNGKYEVLRNELKKTGAITEMAGSSSPLTGINSMNKGFSWAGKDPGAYDPTFNTIAITPEYGKTIGWKFIDGRDFSRTFTSDSSDLIINQAAAKLMGLKNPVGEPVAWAPDWGKKTNFKILGVVKDMIMESPYSPVNPSVFFLQRGGDNLFLKINPHLSAGDALNKIEKVFKSVVPDAQFDYKFVDEDYAAKFAAEERVGQLAGCLASLAIFISCIGLFGMASFMAEQRTKEIGVRKVLGATVFGLWRLMSKDFVILVIISLFIAIPIAYYFLHSWLQNYSYRTNLSWWIFAATALGTVMITLLTVSYQSIKAALANPVKSLRSE